MKKLTVSKTALINVLLIAVLLFVFAVSFFPERIAPISGNGKISAVYRGNPNKAEVSLMFNVYQGSEYVEAILDTLSERGAKATFFVGGSWADDNKDLLCRIVGEGHELANHGYFHRDHAKLDYERNKEEIVTTERVAEALCGVKTALFAPPSGSFSDTALEVCAVLGYRLIMGSKDTIDWRDQDGDKIYRRATENLANGDLVLMHPTKETANTLPAVLDYYASVGFTAVTVSRNLEET